MTELSNSFERCCFFAGGSGGGEQEGDGGEKLGSS